MLEVASVNPQVKAISRSQMTGSHSQTGVTRNPENNAMVNSNPN